MPKALAIGPTYTCSVPCLFNSSVILLCVDCSCLCLQNCVPVWTALLATVSRTELFYPRKVCDTNVIVYFIWNELCWIIAMPVELLSGMYMSIYFLLWALTSLFSVNCGSSLVEKICTYIRMHLQPPHMMHSCKSNSTLSSICYLCRVFSLCGSSSSVVCT